MKLWSEKWKKNEAMELDQERMMRSCICDPATVKAVFDPLLKKTASE